MNYKNDVEALDAFVTKYKELNTEIKKVIIGQEGVVKDVLISIFSRGHCLLVGVPGLAKTLLVNTISDALGLSYSRIQFTPDLMPSDIIGTEILDEGRQFKFIKGPLFANIILADEINRTPPKTQSALLEAMQERAVTAAGKRYDLAKPFFVLATQNPIEQEGTYPLPEAQLDRFMFNVWLDYPSYQEELTVVKNTTSNYTADLKKVLNAEEINYFQDLIRRIPIADNVLECNCRCEQSPLLGCGPTCIAVFGFGSEMPCCRSWQVLARHGRCSFCCSSNSASPHCSQLQSRSRRCECGWYCERIDGLSLTSLQQITCL
jgi:MoxR-like ATPase